MTSRPSESSNHQTSLRAVSILITLAAIVFASACYLLEPPLLADDAGGHYLIATLIVKHGPWNYPHIRMTTDPNAPDPVAAFIATRPYGYAMIEAIIGYIVGTSEKRLVYAVFICQLAAYLAICAYCARRIGLVFRSIWAAIGAYLLTALNPFLLILTTQALTDLSSAALVYLAVVLALPTDAERPEPRVGWRLVLSLFCVAASAVIRSGNLPVIVAVVAVWLLRAWRVRDVPWRALPAAGLAVVLPFIPQVIVNYRAFHVVSPVAITNIYATHLIAGTYFLKYATVHVPDQPRLILYVNPFRPEGVASPEGFLQTYPLGYLLTLALHTFALVDQDFPFPYIQNLDPWYRWPLSLWNYAFVVAGLAGFGLGLIDYLRTRKLSAPLLALAATLLVILASLVAYVPGEVENRYAAPILLLAVPAALYAARAVAGWVRHGGARRVVPLAVAGLLLVAGCGWLSTWMQSQAWQCSNWDFGARALLSAQSQPGCVRPLRGG